MSKTLSEQARELAVDIDYPGPGESDVAKLLRSLADENDELRQDKHHLIRSNESAKEEAARMRQKRDELAAENDRLRTLTETDGSTT